MISAMIIHSNSSHQCKINLRASISTTLEVSASGNHGSAAIFTEANLCGPFGIEKENTLDASTDRRIAVE